MRSRRVVIFGVGFQHTAQMVLIKNNDVIETFAPDRTDQSFDIAVLPWRSKRRWAVADAHRFQLILEGGAIDRVIVSNERVWRLVPRKCFSKLLRGPFSCRMRGNAKVQELASPVRHDNEYKEEFETDRRDNKEITGGDAVSMIADKCLPVLRRRSAVFDHILGN